MAKKILDTITDDEINNIGMKILTDGRDFDGPSQFIQIGDKEGVLDDGNYICHYEILHMGENTPEYGNHKKNNIYVEIHFENDFYSPCFQEVVNDLITNPKLESFYWRPYCTGLRLKDSIFTSKDKTKIIKNLETLKELTISELLKVYKATIGEINNWKSEFSLESGKRCNSKRALSEYYREPKEIYVIHEQIKNKLIKKIKKNNALLDATNPIVLSTLSPENPVNVINYIDLAAKNKKGDIIFFEIKTAADARLCIRQALGQLMEYAFYPYENTEFAQKLVVVGMGEKNNEVIQYLNKLNKRFNIPIDYLQISIKSE